MITLPIFDSAVLYNDILYIIILYGGLEFVYQLHAMKSCRRSTLMIKNITQILYCFWEKRNITE